MATIKSYTDLDQSKKLAKILPLESADMLYWVGEYITHPYMEGQHKDEQIPVWSLAALLGVIRETVGYTLYGVDVNNVYMSCNLGDKPWELETELYGNEVDACVEMIIKLHENNLL